MAEFEAQADLGQTLEELLRNLEAPELTSSVHAVLEAGKAILQNKDQGIIETKGDEYVGHHAIVTKEDTLSQDTILRILHKDFPDAYFITEEKSGEELEGEVAARILSRENYQDHLSGLVFGIDPIDGSSQRANGGPEWSISIGAAKDGQHIAGAVFAPDIRGGQLVFGARGKGLWVSEYGRPPKKVEIEEKGDRDLLIYGGVDICLDPKFNHFVNEMANDPKTRTYKTDGSCPQGLIMAALGRVDAFIQPTQRVWDWFGSVPLLEEAGMKLQFYRFENSKPVAVAHPLPADYDPESRNLGFVAGRSAVVDRLWTQITQQYGTAA